MCLLPFLTKGEDGERGGWVWLNFPNSQKGGWLDKTSIFIGGLLGKTGVTYFRVGGYTFYIRNKPKSYIFNDKKVLLLLLLLKDGMGLTLS